jgi:hypothetical protein
MKIEIFIYGDKYLYYCDSISESFLNIIKSTSSQKEYFELHKTKPEEIKFLKEACLKDNLVETLGKHLTLELDFAMKLNAFDIVYCHCIHPLTELGKVIKELMIDNYQIILTNRNWITPDHLRLHFELVDQGEADIFLINALRKRT